MCAYLYLYPLCSCMCPQGVRLGVRPDSPALPRPSRTIKVETGCNVGNPCNSSPCPTHSQCTDEWDRHTCVCEPGKMSIMIVQNQNVLYTYIKWGPIVYVKIYVAFLFHAFFITIDKNLNEELNWKFQC